MTTPQQPGDDLKVEAEVIEDLDAPADSQQQIGGGQNTGANSVLCQ